MTPTHRVPAIEVSVGDVLEADDGFTCIRDRAQLSVQENEHGLFVACTEGHHYLDGQLDDDGRYVGFRKVPQ